MEWINELVLPGGDVAASNRAQGSIFFVGNATVILSYAGFTILTDPNFLHRGDHVHLGHGMTAARRTEPALELEALPPIDFVLLSHMHEDHFDREVERKLDHSLPIVTTPHAAAGKEGRARQRGAHIAPRRDVHFRGLREPSLT
jgi:L-ascorbate metabolism protein UlaG (beta-lactamase superfamily)